MSAIRERPAKRAFLILMILVIMIIVLFPAFWIVSTSLKGPLEVSDPRPTLLPRKATLENFKKVLTKTHFLRNLGNSLLVTVSSTLISLFIAFITSYALIRYKFPLKFNIIFLVWILVVKILPPVVLSIPLYTLFNSLKLINNLSVLIIAYQVYTLPYCIWMIFGFLKTLPREFEEAAQIDGASKWYILFRIVLPLVRAGVVATSIFSCITAWDEFLFALLFIRTPAKRTLPLLVASFLGEFEIFWGQLMAVGILTCIPVLLFTKAVYKYYTQGFSMSLK